VKPSRIAVLLCIVLTTPLAAQKSIDLAAARSETELRWGVLAWHRGAFNDAVLAFEKAIGIDPSNSRALDWLGRALLKSGYVPEALDAWDRLAASGKATPLLADQLKLVRTRAGIAPDLPVERLEGRYVVSVRLDGSARGGHVFRRPTAVRPLADGTFFVAAFGSNEILHYDANNRLLAALRGGPGGLDRPFDVLPSADGSCIVSEYGANRIVKLNARGDRVAEFGASITASGTGASPGAGRASAALLGPQYLAADGRGRIWVTDWGNSRAVAFDQQGTFILAVAGLAGPSGIAVRGGMVYVSEKGAGRIAVFDLSGNRLGTIGEGSLVSPEGLSFAADGKLLVADAGRLIAGDLERETWFPLGDASSAAEHVVQVVQAANGEILAADFDGSRIVLLADTASLYTGLWVRIDRVNAVNYPEVFLDVMVETRAGKPVVGLSIDNFVVTEGRFSVGRTELVRRTAAPDVALLVERSPALEKEQAAAKRAAEELHRLVTADGRLSAVSAGERAVREAEYGETRLRFVDAAFKAATAAGWRFDAGLRLAADSLVVASTGARRAIVFFTAGSTGPDPWRGYSITELAAYLQANEIAFYPVYFAAAGVDEDLAWLAAQSGGRSFGVNAAGGMREVMAAVKTRETARYTIRYTSASDAEFGQRYLPLEVEVTLQKTSGRDELGYYAPSQ
jgi:DNA-binding beta-propeller fold protein YncE